MLELSNLRVRYDKAEALKGVSLHVEEGEIVSLIGSNGAGKTTALRAISGLVPLAGGEIRFRDERIDRLAPHGIVQKGIAHVPEGRRVFGALTVQENLELGAYRRSDREGIARDFERMYASFPILRERRRQKAGSLSGGEQQMLAMARALMTSPRLLLLDEPSIGLAPLVVREIARIIREINRQGVTVVLIEQNARMALKLAHRAYVLELGGILLEGPAEALARDEMVKRAYLGTGAKGEG